MMLVDGSSAVRGPWAAALNTEQLKVMESPDGESAPASSRKARVLGINAWAVQPIQAPQFVCTVRSLIGQDVDEST